MEQINKSKLQKGYRVAVGKTLFIILAPLLSTYLFARGGDADLIIFLVIIAFINTSLL